MKYKIHIWLLIGFFVASLFETSDLEIHFVKANVFQYQIKTSGQGNPLNIIEDTRESGFSVKKKFKQLTDKTSFQVFQKNAIPNSILFIFCPYIQSIFDAFDTSPPRDFISYQ